MTTRRRAVLILALLLGLVTPWVLPPAQAAPECQQVLLVFARGSGQGFRDPEATAFFNLIEANISDGVDVGRVELGDLDDDLSRDDRGYPAVPMEEWFFAELSLDIMSGYHRSVATGVAELTTFLNQRAQPDRCPNETVVLGGYSQGADVVGATLPLLNDQAIDRLGFVALFGDPRFNPGGLSSVSTFGTAPWARGDRHWYQLGGGILSARDPYVPRPRPQDRAASWCDRNDIICSFPNIDSGHYVYPTKWMLLAANEIALKLKTIRPDLADDLNVTAIPVELRAASNVDVAFVVDTTGSMFDDIAAAQDAISQLTGAIFGLAPSARVSLVDYKDEGDAYQAQVDSPFTADRDAFADAVSALFADGGGDTPESVYSGLMTAFDLNWRDGALKLAILIGDAPAKDPEPVTDFTLEQVLQTAFELDPVVINPIVVGDDPEAMASFQELAEGSNGQVFAAADATEVVAAIEDAIEAFSLAPVAAADGPYTGAPGDNIVFTGSASYDPDGAIVNYAWDFDNNGTIDEDGPSPVVVHAYDASYHGLAALTVTAADGGIASSTAEVEIAPGLSAPQPPSVPRSVRAEVAGATSVDVSWQRPSDSGDGPIGAYRIYDSEGVLLSVVSPETTNLTIADVPTGVEVQFSVEALNEFGTGPPGVSNTVRLGEGGTPTPTATPTPSQSDEPSATPSPTDQARPPTGPDDLAGTGSNLGRIVAMAMVALTLGSALVVFTRVRRQSGAHRHT